MAKFTKSHYIHDKNLTKYTISVKINSYKNKAILNGLLLTSRQNQILHRSWMDWCRIWVFY